MAQIMNAHIFKTSHLAESSPGFLDFLKTGAWLLSPDDVGIVLGA